MKMKLDIITKESIKPSSPTPHHLRTFNLSIFDQLAPPFHIPTLLFYPAPIDPTDIVVDRLKKSLSMTLTHFYPVAGRIDGNASFVDCNDDGVDFIEVRLDGSELSEVLNQPEVDVLKQLLPYDPYSIRPVKEVALMAVQVNIFDCGGMAITVCTSHKIADAMSLASFLKGWSAIAAGRKFDSPYLDLASLFPPKDFPMLMPSRMASKYNKLVTRRFVFDASKLSILKATVANGNYPLSRVEAITALMWKSAMAITRDTSGKVKPSMVSHLVSLRERMTPPLPENYLGNLWWFVVAPSTEERQLDEVELHGLVGQLRNSIKKIDCDFVRGFQEQDGLVKIFESLGELKELAVKGEMEIFTFTSVCRVPFYGADFGWGKPVWVCTVTSPVRNVITLTSGRNDEGIEAWVTMEEQDMTKFECDCNLLEFSSLASKSA